ncbi:MAG: GNAT family N-acetyltransferase [Oscillospiraceae bacterium]
MKYEIRNCNLSDIAGLKLLWAEVFHDDAECIDRFFESIFSIENTFVAVDAGGPVAMMFMLPATLAMKQNALKAGYIYAVATDKGHRGQGLMKQLEHYVSEQATLRGFCALALVPASKSLFKMYRNIGYQTSFYKASTIITPKVCNQASLTDCELDYFLEKRKDMLLEHHASFELNDVCKKYRFETLKVSGEVLVYKDDRNEGYIVGQKNGSRYYILETSLQTPAIAKAAYALMEKYYKLKKITLVGKNGALTPYGMLKPLDNRVNIFDIIKLNPYMNLMLE